MKTAIIGSRELTCIDISSYIPTNTTLIISGGARGIDALAENYADTHGIPKIIFKPDYNKYEEKAPFVRNRLIVKNADIIVAIWNGTSKGTKHTIDYARRLNKKVKIVLIDPTGTELMPGNMGADCNGNGSHIDKQGKQIECCCDECDYLQCCLSNQIDCAVCADLYCPRR